MCFVLHRESTDTYLRHIQVLVKLIRNEYFMTMNSFILKGDLNWKIVEVCFFFLSGILLAKMTRRPIYNQVFYLNWSNWLQNNKHKVNISVMPKSELHRASYIIDR